MIKFLLWCILLFLCWPLALLALVLYPAGLDSDAAVSTDRNCRRRRLRIALSLDYAARANPQRTSARLKPVASPSVLLLGRRRWRRQRFQMQLKRAERKAILFEPGWAGFCFKSCA